MSVKEVISWKENRNKKASAIQNSNLNNVEQKSLN